MTKPIIRCSSLDRIINCSHSLLLPVEDNDNAYATKGREQHALAAKYLTNELLDYKHDRKLDDNTITYIEYVLGLSGGDNRFIEVKKQINVFGFILEGTVDAAVLDACCIEIVDLKSGFVDVSPLSNQLKGYGLLWGTHYFGSDNLFTDKRMIKLTIVQDNKIKTITLTFKDVLELSKIINTSINKKTYALGAHCQYCPSKIHCKKLVDKVKPDTQNTKDMIEMVRHKPLIEKLLTEQKDYLLKNKPTWFDRKTRKLKYWVDESKAPLGNRKLLTPAAALKINNDYESNIKILDSYSYNLKERLADD